MPSVVVAPDKFKGSLAAAEVAAHLAAGLRRGSPGLRVSEIPLADGGEGTVDAALSAGAHVREVRVTGPLGTPVDARYALAPNQGDGPTAVLEMALASGLSYTAADDRSARESTSFGTGELISDALDAGARRIVLGVGGSASTDGGAGLIAALGGRLLDCGGADLAHGGDALRRLARVDLTGLDRRLGPVEVVLAADVENPLLGATGAAAVYSAQKGAGAHTVADLEAGLNRWVEALAEAGVEGARSAAWQPGAGAAGGVGYAAQLLLGAHRRRGIEMVLELTGFGAALEGSVLVVTGEGSLDEQSLFGKTPVGVAAAARAAGVPTIAVAGRTTLSRDELTAHGFADRYLLTEFEPDVAVCLAEAGRLLEDVGERIAVDHVQETR
ncbi:glycerate kinase [Pseudactinotalea sp.]|uniref:glycerate kinase n=1 Tax=Pseudactinotalea sp. TaxID=1926260 RepID=UPI003B3B8943